jgi:thymidine phosphorylase
MEIVVNCAAHLLVQTGKSDSIEAARQKAQDCLNSGQPLRKWDEMLAAQGADLEAFRRKLKDDHTAAAVLEVKSPKPGYVSSCNARVIGEMVRDLGGGRLTKESTIDYDVGVDRIAKPGETIKGGDTLARIHAKDRAQAEAAAVRVGSAFGISEEPPKIEPLLAEVIS